MDFVALTKELIAKSKPVGGIEAINRLMNITEITPENIEFVMGVYAKGVQKGSASLSRGIPDELEFEEYADVLNPKGRTGIAMHALETKILRAKHYVTDLDDDDYI